jgi:hypothetical protein
MGRQEGERNLLRNKAQEEQQDAGAVEGGEDFLVVCFMS